MESPKLLGAQCRDITEPLFCEILFSALTRAFIVLLGHSRRDQGMYEKRMNVVEERKTTKMFRKSIEVNLECNSHVNLRARDVKGIDHMLTLGIIFTEYEGYTNPHLSFCISAVLLHTLFSFKYFLKVIFTRTVEYVLLSFSPFLVL